MVVSPLPWAPARWTWSRVGNSVRQRSAALGTSTLDPVAGWQQRAAAAHCLFCWILVLIKWLAWEFSSWMRTGPCESPEWPYTGSGRIDEGFVS
eukprot:9284377-Pyramimonas_sp.AAC.1